MSTQWATWMIYLIVDFQEKLFSILLARNIKPQISHLGFSIKIEFSSCKLEQEKKVFWFF